MQGSDEQYDKNIIHIVKYGISIALLIFECVIIQVKQPTLLQDLTPTPIKLALMKLTEIIYCCTYALFLKTNPD